MRVQISANNEAKAQLAKLYFEVKINVSKGKESFGPARVKSRFSFLITIDKPENFF